MICTCGREMILGSRKKRFWIKDIRLCTHCGRAVRLLTLASGEIVSVVIWPGRYKRIA
jgi:hypothetical protein